MSDMLGGACSEATGYTASSPAITSSCTEQIHDTVSSVAARNWTKNTAITWRDTENTEIKHFSELTQTRKWYERDASAVL